MKISHNVPFIDAKDKNAIMNTLDTLELALGNKVNLFEHAMIKYLRSSGSACAVANGTSALFLALYALNIKAGDEVIVPTYVCSAVLNAIYMSQAIPILADVELADFNISARLAKKAITKRTKAIIVPHIYGAPADLDNYVSLGIPIIEDCAQAIGAKYRDKIVGTIGDISVFSFYATKLITTGQGGMVFSRKQGMIDRIRDYLDFDCRRNYYPRFNFKMTDIQAALGISQLSKLNEFLKRRREIAAVYQKIAIRYGIKTQECNDRSSKVYYRFVVQHKKRALMKSRLQSAGIQTIIPIEKWELLHRYLDLRSANYPNAENIADTSLSLPIYPALKDSEVHKIASSFEKACRELDK